MWYYIDGFKMAGIENIANHCFFNSLMHCVLNRQEVRHAVFNHFTFQTKGREEQGKSHLQCYNLNVLFDMPSQILQLYVFQNILCVIL